MCLFEKEESKIFPQGGTYNQYRRRIGHRPDLIGVCSLAPFLTRLLPRAIHPLR